MVILPGCTCCWQQPQPCYPCVVGSPPDTVTVSLSNIHVKSDDLIGVSISSCFGSGAAGRVTSPGGGPGSDGPVAAVSVTNGGSDYAVVGRVAPTITAGGGSGEDAEFTITLSQSQDACGIDSWSVESIAVSGGTGYQDGDQVSFTTAEGDTVETPAVATIQTTRSEPTLAASVAGGSGAAFTITLDTGYTANTWTVASVDVTDGGSGYTDGSAFGVSLDDDEFGSGLYAIVRTGRVEPTLSLAISTAAGTGATLTATLTSTTDYDYRPAWYVSGVTIDAAGTGYAADETVSLTITDGTGYNTFSGSVTVDGNGAITGVTVNDGGLYWKSDGVIEAVDVLFGGSYWRDDGVPTGVTVADGGVYYREDATVSPYVSSVTVTLTQGGGVIGYDPTGASGAVVTAVVDDDTDSANFGKITALSVTNGGDGYLAWGHEDGPLEWFNGKTFVLQRGDGCQYTNECTIDGCTVQYKSIVFYPGLLFATDKPFVRILNNVIQNQPPAYPNCFATAAFFGDKSIYDCETLSPASGEIAYVPTVVGPFDRSLVDGATATVTPGGEYEPAMKCDRITADGMDAVSVQVQWRGFTFNPEIGVAGSGPCIDGSHSTCRPIPGKSVLCEIDNDDEWATITLNLVWTCQEPGRKAVWTGDISGTYDQLLPSPIPPFGLVRTQVSSFPSTTFTVSAADPYPNGSVTFESDDGEVTVTFTAPP